MWCVKESCAADDTPNTAADLNYCDSAADSNERSMRRKKAGSMLYFVDVVFDSRLIASSGVGVGIIYLDDFDLNVDE